MYTIYVAYKLRKYAAQLHISNDKIHLQFAAQYQLFEYLVFKGLHILHMHFSRLLSLLWGVYAQSKL